MTVIKWNLVSKKAGQGRVALKRGPDLAKEHHEQKNKKKYKMKGIDFHVTATVQLPTYYLFCLNYSITLRQTMPT